MQLESKQLRLLNLLGGNTDTSAIQFSQPNLKNVTDLLNFVKTQVTQSPISSSWDTTPASRKRMHYKNETNATSGHKGHPYIGPPLHKGHRWPPPVHDKPHGKFWVATTCS